MFRTVIAAAALALLICMQGSLLTCRVKCGERAAEVAMARTGESLHGAGGGAEWHASGALPGSPHTEGECCTECGSFDVPNSGTAVIHVGVSRTGWHCAMPDGGSTRLHFSSSGEWLGGALPPVRTAGSPPALTIRI